MADGSIPGVILEPAGGSGNGEDGKKQAQRDRLLEAVLAAKVGFWRDADGAAYATVPGEGGKLACYRVRSRVFALVIRGIYGQSNPRTVGSGAVLPGSVSDTAMAEALPALEALALTGPVHAPDVRVVAHAGAVWLDLGGDDWRTVRVDAKGWRVVEGADVPLVRTEGVRALPEPVRVPPAQALAALARFTNSEEPTGEGAEAEAACEAARRRLMLFAGWLTGALHPAGPYAVLAVDGEAGSSKSTTCRVLRRLVDPNKADLRAPPRNEDSLVVAATSSRVVALDNVSFIEADTADALCRLATGGGLSKRRLYTDGEEHLVAVARPVLLNGIPSLLARGDLADRALAVTLPPIPDAKRRPEAEVWREFKTAAPGILALLLDALAMGLRDMGTVRLPRLPRMADFARLVCAAAPAFGWEPVAMLDALEGNRADAIEAVIEADPVAVAVRTIADERKGVPWTGTASELLPLVNERTSLEQQRERGWPKDAARLSARLRRVAPALRRAGIELVLPTVGGRGGRVITIKAQERAEERSQRSERSDPSESGIYRNAAERWQRSGNADERSQDPASVPERSAGSEQDQELEPPRNAGNAGNASAPTLGGGYL